MEHNLLDKRSETDYLCSFQHRFAFYVFNLHEVISAELINTRADYYKPVVGNGYFWARYEIQVSYRCAKDGGNIRKKIFSRGCIINDPRPVSPQEQPAYTCAAVVSCQAAPFLPALFPFLSRVKFVPFKIWLDVAGKIKASAGERGSGPAACACTPGREERPCLENVTCDLQGFACKVEAAEHGEERAVVDLDLMALEKKEMPPGPVLSNTPVSEFKRYCNMLVEHELNIRQQLERKAAGNLSLRKGKKPES